MVFPDSQWKAFFIIMDIVAIQQCMEEKLPERAIQAPPVRFPTLFCYEEHHELD